MLIHVDLIANYQKETIPCAVSIPPAELPERLKTIPKDTTFVFLCNRGPRSSQATKIAEAAVSKRSALSDREMVDAKTHKRPEICKSLKS